MVWFKFLLCLAVILFAGTKLVRYGDAIAEKTGLGRIWIGLVLIAVITSMPELVTGISSAALVKLPDLAFGTLFGSCSINLTLLALLDILHRKIPVLSEASQDHMVSAAWGILLIGIAGGGILAGKRFSGSVLGWEGIPGIILVVLYLAGVWWVFHLQHRHRIPSDKATQAQYGDIKTRTMYSRFALAATAIIVAGIWLSFIGNEIGETTGWNNAFIGSLFLAITSSMPELAVTIGAQRVGAIDMAIADILGSNMFNIALIAPVALFYTEGSLFSAASNSHLITMLVVIIMNILVILGLRFRQSRKVFSITSWYAPLLIGLYVFGAYVLFNATNW